MGFNHTCALTTAGGVKCWGSNNLGQLGDGTTTSRDTPVDVVGLSTGVVSVALGYARTCAVTNTGAVKCWGNNSTGQLGDGTTTNRSSPADVIGLSSGAVSVSLSPYVGDSRTCIVTSSGEAKCWGDNGYGQLGINYMNLTPQDVVFP